MNQTVYLSFLLLLASFSSAQTSFEELGSDQWETVAELQQAPGNITADKDGRIFFSLHQHYQPALRMGQLDPKDSTKILPFPNPELAVDAKESPLALNSVLGVQSDEQGVIWMLDNAMRGDSVPKLLGWKPGEEGGSLHQVIYLPHPVVGESPFLNDLAVDRSRNHIYIADTSMDGNPALIVVDMQSGASRRVLENHVSVKAEDIPMLAGGELVHIALPDGEVINPKVAVNPIALDAKKEFLYYGPMTGTKLYRVPTAALRDRSLSAEALAEQVELWATRPISDGISLDQAGNVYISAVATNEIGVIRADTRSYSPLFRGDELSWPDAFSFGEDGWMYAVINQLHKGPVLNGGKDESQAPYRIIRFKPLAPGVVGR